MNNAPQTSENKTGTILYLVLLLALGANTLIVELTIPRMIAPIFGNTLFSWTAIIAVVLVALTVGYRLGGILATRLHVGRQIVVFSAATALWGFALSFAGDAIVKEMGWLNMMFGPLAAAAVLAFVPAFLDAAVVPMVIQAMPGEPGNVSGRCFAWSTVGSIIGVVATGYVLLPLLGVSGALITGALLVSITLVAITRKALSLALVFVAVGAGYLAHDQSRDVVVDISNGYHRIRVTENNQVRSLYLDNTLEGQVRLGDVKPVASYMVKVGELIKTNLLDHGEELDSAFFLGGGSFSIPRYLKYLHPSMDVHVAEIDPEVIAIGKEFLELDDQVNVLVGDGRQTLKNSERKYDLIVNDAFQGVRKIPFHLTTAEFNRIVQERMSDNGIYMTNVRGHPANSYLASSFVKTLSQDFPYLYSERAAGHNYWVIASKRPLNWARPIDKVGAMAQILTDNHAPIEFLIVRDFVAERLGRSRS